MLNGQHISDGKSNSFSVNWFFWTVCFNKPVKKTMHTIGLFTLHLNPSYRSKHFWIVTEYMTIEVKKRPLHSYLYSPKTSVSIYLIVQAAKYDIRIRNARHSSNSWHSLTPQIWMLTQGLVVYNLKKQIMNYYYKDYLLTLGKLWEMITQARIQFTQGLKWTFQVWKALISALYQIINCKR